MKKTFFLILFFAIPVFANAQSEEVYPPLKMKIVVQEILNSFQMSSVSTSSIGKHISQEWLEENNINLKNYNINSYAPTSYEIELIFDRYVVAQIRGESWGHLLVFKFIDEDGVYRIIPKGISSASNDYIDPWYDVQQYNVEN
ncbi:MAG: hypothetical protein KDC42_02425 [Ignavibacteriae bacterium]|nr:hypothetical protein [Ignavibacteriota bacterium]